MIRIHLLTLACKTLGPGRWSAVVAAFLLLSAIAAIAAEAPVFSETWESYTSEVTPYGDWLFDKGSWGKISDTGRNGGKCFFVPGGVLARIRHKVDFSNCKDIVLQGWLYDSGPGENKQMNRCILGLTEVAYVPKGDNPLIRMGIGASGHHLTYTIVFYDYLQSNKSILVDTKMESEKGWHFMRLEILHDRTVNYQVWNAAKTVEAKGSFGWVFNKSKFKYILVGSGQATPGDAGWDDIQAGSLEQLGPAPQLPK